MRDRSLMRAVAFALIVGPCLACQPPLPDEQRPPVIGLADFHNHQFAYLGFGGSAISHSVHPADPCRTMPTFSQALMVKDIVRAGLFGEATAQAASGHCYPSITNVASQRVDTDNLRRAWEYGLRLIVMMAVSSEFLCEAADLANPCPTDRVAIEQQIRAARDLERSIDSVSGGPGSGWYRIVETPAQARSAIEQGKLAVVLGIEAANAFGCRVVPGPSITGILPLNQFEVAPSERSYRLDCADGLIGDIPFFQATDPQEDLSLLGSQATHKALALFEHYWKLGVRHFYLVHNIDGLAAGTALSINLLHGEYNPSDLHPGSSPLLDRRDEINRIIKAIRPPVVSANCGGTFPFDNGRCNDKGVSPAGIELVRLMAANGALIDADHISLKARRALLGKEGLLGGVYPLISSHSGASALMPNAVDPIENNGNNEGQLTDDDIGAIVATGGSFAPRLPPVTRTRDQRTYPAGATAAVHNCGGTSESFVQVYRYLVDKLQGVPQPDGTVAGGRLLNGQPAFVGIGIGTDFGPPIPVFASPRFYTPGVITGGFDAEALVIGKPTGSPGRCYNINDPSSANPRVTYPFTSTSPLSAGRQFGKSTTPWDGRAGHPGYDVSLDGVIHIGLLPDFVEEMRVLGLSEAELQPLWHGAEAYIRTWEVAEVWKSSFDREGSAGIRAGCEQSRSVFLQELDSANAAGVVAAMRALAAAKCRGIP